MARFFDSEHAFTQRLSELGLDDIKQKFVDLKWTSFSVLAFVTDFVPGTSSPDIFTREVITPLVGDDPAVVTRWKPLLKRLFVEAYTMAAHDIQTRTEGPDPDEPRKMPNAEREHRLSTLRRKLPGLNLEGELQPSYHLIDICSAMFESGNVSYISWEKCTKRDAEILSRDDAKVDRVWKPDSEGRIREVSAANPPKLEVGSDLLLRYALQRRGLALEIAAVCDFNTHELWVQVLFDALLRPVPPGYAKVTWNQLRMADKEVFTIVARECRGGLRWSVGEQPPFDKALRSAINDPSVRLLMMPLAALPAGSPASSSAGAAVPPGTPGTGLSRNQRRKQQARQKQQQQEQDRAAKRHKGDGKGGGKGDGKGPRNGQLMAGKSTTTSSGEPICFNYNLRGCPNAAAGAKCHRGWHLCAEPGCQKAHPMSEHRS